MEIKKSKRTTEDGFKDNSFNNKLNLEHDKEIELIQELSKNTFIYPIPVMAYKDNVVYLKGEFSFISKKRSSGNINDEKEHKKNQFLLNKAMIPTPGNPKIKRVDIEIDNISMDEPALLDNRSGDFSEYNAKIRIKRHYRNKKEDINNKNLLENCFINNSEHGVA